MAQSSGKIDQPIGRLDSSSHETATAAPSSDEIRSQIEHTRAEMSETIDAIQARLAPHRLLTNAKDTVREATVGRVKRLAQKSTDKGAQPFESPIISGMSSMLESARNNRVPIAVASMAATALLLRALKGSRHRTRSEPLDNAGVPMQGRRKSHGIGRNQARMIAVACAGLACCSTYWARRSAATFRTQGDRALTRS